MATATVEPTPPDRLGGLGSFGSISPSEEKSPDAVSTASEATETGQSLHITYQIIISYQMFQKQGFRNIVKGCYG